MNTLRTSISALLCAVAAQSNATMLTIGIDMSGSNPVLSSPDIAVASGRLVKSRIAALEPGDVVVLKTLGNLSAANARSERFLISKRNQMKVAAQIAGYVATLPAKKLAGQESTNLVAWYEFGEFDCAHHGAILTISDAIEGSAEISAKQFLSGKPLPKPKTPFLTGCAVQIVGLGTDTDGRLTPVQTRHIRNTWQSWMTAAGATFNAIINP